ncbi:MAG TPA: sigma-54 dependent transcriptional regulator [Chitinophagaceae bacterium]|nr:sigma-54 dependent transcriptional regulator [Chitinophagaceae bacterium]
MRNNILIIDDDIDLCTVLARFLSKNGYETDIAHTGYKGIARFTEKKFDVVICDYRLGDMEGKDVVSSLKKLNQQVIVLVITGYSDIKTAVEVIKLGALDYITKPLIPDEVLNVLNKALNQTADNGTIKKIPAALSNGNGSSNKLSAKRLAGINSEFFIGQSPAAEALYAQVDIVAATNYSIILYGESGTGKEVIAKTIHQLSDRRDKPFVAMDCGTLSKELSGSELFGHVKGAFTGALQDKEGHFELADGGTLFLDEVGNLSPEVQATLLRVIQERKFKKVGGNKEIQVDVRIIVASNENLQEAYRKGKFREDLYHRFNEFSISLPPLRSRKEDIPLFADFFLQKTTEELNKEVAGFEDDVRQTFLQYSWPGNLREFRNVVRRAVLLTDPGKKIISVSLPWEITNSRPFLELNEEIPLQPIQKSNKEEVNLKEAATKAEFETIMTVLQQVNFNKKRAAELLKIDRKTLYNKIKNYQM